MEALRRFGHDILTVQESGNAGFADPQVLAFAIGDERAVLTQNRRDFMRLHRLQSLHAGIIACTDDRNFERLASRIHAAIIAKEALTGQLIRVNRPA